jgi:hypothetical protein
MSDDIRLEIDGEDFTAECDEIRFGVPRVVYEEDDGRSRKCFLGPQGFQVTLINPTDRARALVDGGRDSHVVTIAVAGNAISHATHFIDEWTTKDGTRKVFGRLAWDSDRDARWIDEPQLAEA